ncbi:MAG: AAA family ATPase [Prevotellaceae bacterium]|jgi:predicted ATPase|nr:AAA family ATPase [Prevotellaceae bacterium]
MKESIHIKNLGPIKKISIDDIKPFTVLIGESGSGKSTLMKTVALFRYLYKICNIRSYLKHSNISKVPFPFTTEEYFRNCGFNQFVKNDTEISYKAKFENNEEYEISYKNKKLSVAKKIDKDNLHFNKISFISETRNLIPLWADKGASTKGAYLGFYFHEVYDDFNLATEEVKEMPLDFLNLKFKVKNTNSGKKYSILSIDEDDFEIDYKNSSSGIQNTVPISLITEYFSKHFDFEKAFDRSALQYVSRTGKLKDFTPVHNLDDINKKIYIHIEEPELSLFPDAQCQLMNDIIDKCFIKNKHEVELFLSTHSPYIINHLNLLIKAYDKNTLIDGVKFNYDDLAVYQVEEGKIVDLKIQNERLINTNPLSDIINSIYDQYALL